MDSDMHIIEPADLWLRYIDPQFKDQAPRGLTDAVADLSMVGPDGKPWGRNPKNVRQFSENRRGQSFEHNQDRYKPYEDMGWTGEAQLEGMLGDVHAPELTMAPSACWKRQCFASVEPDEEPVRPAANGDR